MPPPTKFGRAVSSESALSRELQERRDRDAAAVDDGALVAYEAKWQRKLRKLQRANPQRWHVSGLSDEEVRDALTLRLIEAVRSGTADELELPLAGKEWGLLLMLRELRVLRRKFKLRVAPADFNDAPFAARAPTQEEQLLEGEAELRRNLARARAEQGLPLPQRRWLAALKLSARANAFFASSGAPNLSAASRMLGKNRSSAQRAYRELRARFIKERNRLG